MNIHKVSSFGSLVFWILLMSTKQKLIQTDSAFSHLRQLVPLGRIALPLRVLRVLQAPVPSAANWGYSVLQLGQRATCFAVLWWLDQWLDQVVCNLALPKWSLLKKTMYRAWWSNHSSSKYAIVCCDTSQWLFITLQWKGLCNGNKQTLSTPVTPSLASLSASSLIIGRSWHSKLELDWTCHSRKGIILQHSEFRDRSAECWSKLRSLYHLCGLEPTRDPLSFVLKLVFTNSVLSRPRSDSCGLCSLQLPPARFKN